MGGGPDAPERYHASHLVIIVPFPEPEHLLADLRHAYPKLHITFFDQTTGPVVPPSLYRSATILCTWSLLPLNHQVEAPHLRWVHILSTKTKWLCGQAICQNSLGVQLTTSSGAKGLEMAQWALTTWLSHERGHALTHSLHNDQDFDSRHSHSLHSRGVNKVMSKRVGILGYGSIGRQVGRVAKNLGMQVIAYTLTKKASATEQKHRGYTAPGTGDARGAIPVEWHDGTDVKSLHSFLDADLDWLVVTIPYKRSTQNMLGADEFQILSRTHAFVSVITDGPVFSHDELVAALRNRYISGSALKLTNSLHLSKRSPLWKMPNVTVTPHTGIDDMMALDCAFNIFKTNLARLERGKELLNPIAGHE